MTVIDIVISNDSLTPFLLFDIIDSNVNASFHFFFFFYSFFYITSLYNVNVNHWEGENAEMSFVWSLHCVHQLLKRNLFHLCAFINVFHEPHTLQMQLIKMEMILRAGNSSVFFSCCFYVYILQANQRLPAKIFSWNDVILNTISFSTFLWEI